MLQGSFQGVSRMFQAIFKGVSRQCQRCFKEDSRLLKKISSVSSIKFHKKCQGCFKNLPIKFCFAILL